MLGCLLSGPLALHVMESSSTFPTSLFALSSILLSFAATLCQACLLSQYPRHYLYLLFLIPCGCPGLGTQLLNISACFSSLSVPIPPLLFSSKFLRNYHCLPVPSSCLLFFLFLFLFPSIRDQIQGLWHAKEVPRHCPTSPVPWSPTPPRPFSFETKSCQLPRLTFNLRSSNLGLLSM